MTTEQTHIVQEQQYGAYSSGEQEREITDLMLERALSTVGMEIPSRGDGWNTEATRDAIRHYAEAMGMDNPLYSDPEHASNTRWKGIIAPPTFYRTLARATKREWTPEELLRARDPLAGIHDWYAGTHTQWFRPMYVGDALTRRNFRGDYVEKRSEFTGRSVIAYNCTEAWNQRGELVVRVTSHSVRGARQRQWGERQKYAEIEPQTYAPEQLAEVDAAYERMELRGADPRYWDDVEIGEEVTPTVYGPLTISDMICFASANGSLMRGSRSHKFMYEHRKDHPRAFMVNSAGIPDIIEAVHWDSGLSQRTGNPMAYDYGDQRLAWMTHVLTNWISDDGWLLELDAQIRRFVYVGDTEYAKAKVTGKEIRNGQAIVQLDVWMEDQRGRITAPGRAEVMLPSREHGPIALPARFDDPPHGWYVT